MTHVNRTLNASLFVTWDTQTVPYMQIRNETAKALNVMV